MSGASPTISNGRCPSRAGQNAFSRIFWTSCSSRMSVIPIGWIADECNIAGGHHIRHLDVRRKQAPFRLSTPDETAQARKKGGLHRPSIMIFHSAVIVSCEGHPRSEHKHAWSHASNDYHHIAGARKFPRLYPRFRSRVRGRLHGPTNSQDRDAKASRRQRRQRFSAHGPRCAGRSRREPRRAGISPEARESRRRCLAPIRTRCDQSSNDDPTRFEASTAHLRQSAWRNLARSSLTRAPCQRVMSDAGKFRSCPMLSSADGN